jgi:hypothetical protein
MRMKALLGGLAAAALAAQPISAAAVSRAAPVEGENALGGEGGLVGLAIFAAVVAAFYFIASSDDEPASP